MTTASAAWEGEPAPGATVTSSGSQNLGVQLTHTPSGGILDIDFFMRTQSGSLEACGFGSPLQGSAPMLTSAAAIAGSAAMAPPPVPAPAPSPTLAVVGVLDPASAAATVPAVSAVSAAVVPSGPRPAVGGGSGGRRLKILEHTVHKVEMRSDQEQELVVSNLRPFTLKVGVFDEHDQAVECSMPLRASLFYENGLPVVQASVSEPLIYGETDVIAVRGVAVFKLRINSLSSHRDKQRFRIQVAPQVVEVEMTEPALRAITEPMKSVTKLARAAPGAANAQAPAVAATGAQAGSSAGGASSRSRTPPEASSNGHDTLKRRHREMLEVHAEQIQHISQTQAFILSELRALTAIISERRAAPADATPPAAAEEPPTKAGTEAAAADADDIEGQEARERPTSSDESTKDEVPVPPKERAAKRQRSRSSSS